MVLGDNFYSKVVFLDVDIGIVAYSLHQSALYLCTSIVLVVQYAELRVSALAMQVKLTLVCLVKVHTPVHQFTYLFWGHFYYLFYSLWIADVIASNHCIFNMFLEVIQFEIGD